MRKRFDRSGTPDGAAFEIDLSQALDIPDWKKMSRFALANLCGLVFGTLTVLSMLPMVLSQINARRCSEHSSTDSPSVL